MLCGAPHVEALLGDELVDVVVSVDLVYVAVLVPEGTLCAMQADLDGKERFAVLIRLPPLLLRLQCCLVRSELLVVVGEPAALAVSAPTELSHILA